MSDRTVSWGGHMAGEDTFGGEITEMRGHLLGLSIQLAQMTREYGQRSPATYNSKATDNA
ncbi:hypothetical protein ACFV2N_28905 [Streptomyces sp. NPDC059680]|uniref:hypothetical protein n=1 Tax=Streptomyces sp. NPDC059680 TaxID=3346904 RepID=UPI003698C962